MIKLFFRSMVFVGALIGCRALHAEAEPAIMYQGSIDPERVAAFIEKHKDTTATRFKIFSGGGEGMSALRLAHWIIDKNLSVEVNGACFSACANYIFLAGREKIVGKNALVLWHGGAEQKDYRLKQELYESNLIILSKFGIDAFSPLELMEFLDYGPIYWALREVRIAEAEFMKRVGANEYLFRLGQEPVMYNPDCWSVTAAVLTKFGVRNLKTDQTFGDPYENATNPFGRWLCGGKPTSFDLDKNGNIIDVTVPDINPRHSPKQQ